MRTPPDDPKLELMRRCFDGQASEAEFAQVEKWLISDQEFRNIYLSYANIDHTLAAEWQMETRQEEKEPVPATGLLRTQRIWAPLLSAAAGLVLGLFFASIGWAMITVQQSEVGPRVDLTVFEESFEDPEMVWVSGFPGEADVWGGERGQILLNSQQPVPEQGDGIARIESASDTTLSYLQRIVEVEGWPQTEEGEVRHLEVFASFHAEEPGYQERYTLRVAAFAESPESVSSLWEGAAWTEMRDRTLTLTKSGLSTESDATGWQTLSATVVIPAEARCVVISLAAGRLDPLAPKTVHYFDNLQADLLIGRQPKRTPKKRS